MKRPVLIILIYYLAGIIAGRYSDNGTALFAIMLVIAFVLFMAYRRKLIFAAPIFMVIGMSLTTLWLGGDAATYSEVITVHGQIYDISSSEEGRERIDIKSEYGRVRIMTDDGDDLYKGDAVIATGSVDIPEKPTNPGEFDDYMYMKREGLKFRVYADKVIKTGGRKTGFVYYSSRLKKELNNSIDRIYDDNEAALVKAVVTGDKSYISDETRALYTDGGAIHVLCISGLHVGIVAAIIFFIIGKLFPEDKSFCAGMASCVLLAYMSFIGMTPSVVRAVLMSAVAMAAVPLGRKNDGLNNLFIAALVILLMNPMTLFNAGFLLSFATVFGIIISVEYRKFDGRGKRFKDIASTSLFATLFALPITAYYFYSVSIAGIITNLVVLPLTPVVVVSGILSAIVGLFNTFLGGFVGLPALAVLKLYELVLNLAASVPFLNGITGKVDILFCLFYYTALILIIMNKEKDKRKTLVSGVCILCMLFIVGADRFIFKNAEIAFMDVGQGDCAVITDYNRNAYIIDTGGVWYYDEDENTGKRFIYPYLQYKGIDEVDVLFISHPDTDHALGSLSLMDNVKVKEIVFADFNYEESELYDKIVRKARRNGTKISFMESGDKISNGEMVFECLYPFYDSEGSDNAGSMVIRFAYNDFSVLFTGDLGIAQEKIIIDNNIDISADVLKVAHHGSKYSTGEEFIEAVGCDAAVISAGENNYYGHPDSEVMKRLEGINSYVTSVNGAVLIKTDGDDYTISTMK
ncbi:MAG: DNA internalization-related competence protein ComEC/Rec2 [Firmicutes bacterium]|nr:DNA internalization-related competence protein ComEC/Rec2 [Bacillota bacterium]